MRLSQTIQKPTSAASSFLSRQSWIRHCFILCGLFAGGFRVLLLSSGGEADVGGDELECSHVCRCHGVFYGLLLVQGKESICRACGICEEDTVKLYFQSHY